MKIVCNSSVLIALDNAGILHILKELLGPHKNLWANILKRIAK